MIDGRFRTKVSDSGALSGLEAASDAARAARDCRHGACLCLSAYSSLAAIDSIKETS
jgi:hypothetical protein